MEKLISFMKKKDYKKIYVPVNGIGDALIFSALAREIYKRTNKKILVSHKNLELFENNPYIDTIEGYADCSWTQEKYDKLKKLGLDFCYPTYWNYRFKDNGEHVLAYPNKHIIAETCLKAGIIGEIELKPEIYLREEEKKFGRFFEKKEKQIAIMNTAIDKHKQWNKWQEVVDQLKDKFRFVQIGAKSDELLDGVLDKRGLSLREGASILFNSDLFVGQVGGLMHLARAVDCPSVIVYPCAEPLYFASYKTNTNIVLKNYCQDCVKNKRDIYFEGCKKKKSDVLRVKVKNVIKEIEIKLEQEKNIVKEKYLINETYQIKDTFKNYRLRYSCSYSKTMYFKYYIFSIFFIYLIKKNQNISYGYLFGIIPFFKIKIKNNSKKIYLWSIPLLSIKRKNKL